MIKRLLVVLASAALIVGSGSIDATATPAQSVHAVSVAPASNFHALVQDNDISQNTVHSTAYRVGNGTSTRFYGTLQAKTYGGQVYCYQMQRQLSSGAWTTSGFWISENVEVAVLSHCSNEPLNPYETWSIHDGLSVRGIRFTNGVNTGTHCGPLDATECRALTAP